jgi:hypothetical protein
MKEIPGKSEKIRALMFFSDFPRSEIRATKNNVRDYLFLLRQYIIKPFFTILIKYWFGKETVVSGGPF